MSFALALEHPGTGSDSRTESPTLQLEVWLKKGVQIVRLYGRRPTSLPREVHAGLIRLVLQPVEKGLVLAWRPLWERWLSERDAMDIYTTMKREGWEESQRPKVAHNHDSMRPETPAGNPKSIAWDREMTRRRKAEAALRLKPGEFEQMTDPEKMVYRQRWDDELRKKQEFKRMMGIQSRVLKQAS